LPAHEYEEHADVFQAKVALFASLIRQSKNMVAYTGAGISTSSGISDYASRSAGDKSSVQVVKKKGNFIDYEPSYGHRSLVALYFAGGVNKITMTCLRKLLCRWWDDPILPTLVHI
jgi:hypothetical protein